MSGFVFRKIFHFTGHVSLAFFSEPPNKWIANFPTSYKTSIAKIFQTFESTLTSYRQGFSHFTCRDHWVLKTINRPENFGVGDVLRSPRHFPTYLILAVLYHSVDIGWSRSINLPLSISRRRLTSHVKATRGAQESAPQKVRRPGEWPGCAARRPDQVDDMHNNNRSTQNGIGIGIDNYPRELQRERAAQRRNAPRTGGNAEVFTGP